MNDALTLSPRLCAIANEVRACLGRAKWELMVAGQRLLEAKQILPHGQFEDWIESEFDFSPRTAQNFMNVARRFVGKDEIVSLFPTSVLYALSAPSTSERVIDIVCERVEQGEILTFPQVNELIASTRSNGRKPVTAYIADAVTSVTTEVQATGGHVSVNGESIAAAITEQTAESIRADSELIRQRIEAEQGLDGASALRGKATVDYINRDGRVTLFAPELASALRSGQHITFIIYPKD